MNEASFDVYGRLRVGVSRGPAGHWETAEIRPDGKRRSLPDVLIPDEAEEDDLPGYLEAAFHELARPGQGIVRLG